MNTTIRLSARFSTALEAALDEIVACTRHRKRAPAVRSALGLAQHVAALARNDIGELRLEASDKSLPLAIVLKTVGGESELALAEPATLSFQATLDTESANSLEELLKLGFGDSKTDVLRKSVLLYRYLVRQRQDGWVLGAGDPFQESRPNDFCKAPGADKRTSSTPADQPASGSLVKDLQVFRNDELPDGIQGLTRMCVDAYFELERLAELERLSESEQARARELKAKVESFIVRAWVGCVDWNSGLTAQMAARSVSYLDATLESLYAFFELKLGLRCDGTRTRLYRLVREHHAQQSREETAGAASRRSDDFSIVPRRRHAVTTKR